MCRRFSDEGQCGVFLGLGSRKFGRCNDYICPEEGAKTANLSIDPFSLTGMLQEALEEDYGHWENIYIFFFHR